ncbi:LAG1-DNAbind-domain-containing protein [Laetiporus sulphureus 93-53]|uniref:LAG1-DNAbind-domain-containing protein n=1 Tax=Laetiporus sulphureus 93-53 TaxID=1314785 RepID=A0A165GX84_9APHY|nr:LAG1-DNAbind-domain-containing protein [Laetiporus sulphureus 93-53]KZT10953.1 LAG1-DNAbind-domain-containing protein [Laetiporus sulphureus 93-53]
MHQHSLDRVDALAVGDQASYDIFSASSSNSMSGQRFRSAAPPSSMGPGYGMATDAMFPQNSFPETMSSFQNSGSPSYDMINGMSSSYSSGKPSPLTPSDGIGNFHHSPGFPFSNGQSKDFHSHNGFSDVVDRRPSSGSYPSDFNEDYGGMNVNSAMGLGFSPSQLQQFQGRMQSDSRYPSVVPPLTVPTHMHQGADAMRGVNPHATHGFRSDGGVPSYDDMPQYLAPNPSIDFPLRIPSVDLSRMRLQQSPTSGASDLQSFIRPYLDQYVRSPNRLAFGERTVIVMSSKVAQKSYGTEKRFLCPPPTAIMIGNSWWSDVMRRGEEPKLCPPRVVVSISGEPAPQESTIEWTGATGKTFDVSDPPSGTTYLGRCVGKQLYISDVDEKKKKVEALVKIMAPSAEDEPERVIGTFPSRPIKVISKPSKKRQSAKNLELCINHGSTISLFHRLRSQTVSTKYLCVSGSGSSFKGSDGAPLMGLDQRVRTQTPSFIARTASWDPFIMYIVDVNKPAGGVDSPPPPPLQPEYPSPPPNAIPFTNNGSQIPVYYNQTVVLQCLTSGVVSPVLIIRKVDHQTIVVGGGLQEGAKGIADHYCAPGEVCGDPVSQLHKIAFEVYDPSRGPPEAGTPGQSGAFLSCMGEKVNTYRPVDGRIWNAAPGGMSRETGSPLATPGSPDGSTPTSTPGSTDYFGSGSLSSTPTSPDPTDFPSNDGGRVKKGKRGSSSTGGITKPSSQKGRRRPTSAGSAGSSRRPSHAESSASSGALWQVDIGETSVWTIVGTDQIRYNFYVPPVLYDNQNAPQTGSFPVPSKPVTPFPGVVKYLPPDRAAEAPKNHASARAALTKPNPHTAKMLTLYGENFSKTDPVTVFYGSDPSPYVEVRCAEVVGSLPPDSQSTKRRPIILVRYDGVVFPSNVYYP